MSSQWKISLITQSLHLRRQGLSYPAIAVVLREYHGFDVSATGVQHQCRRNGAEPRPRGASEANLLRGYVRS